MSRPRQGPAPPAEWLARLDNSCKRDGIAVLARRSGYSTATISRIHNRHDHPSGASLLAITQALDELDREAAAVAEGTAPGPASDAARPTPWLPTLDISDGASLLRALKALDVGLYLDACDLLRERIATAVRRRS